MKSEKTSKLLYNWIFLIAFILITYFVGCRTIDDFSSESYIWENWSVSSNRIEIIEVKLPYEKQ